MFVHLTIYDIPASLLRDFCKKTVQPNYPVPVTPHVILLRQRTDKMFQTK
jgi:hypothetical protein